jgi:hypothetical protein
MHVVLRAPGLRRRLPVDGCGGAGTRLRDHAGPRAGDHRLHRSIGHRAAEVRVVGGRTDQRRDRAAGDLRGRPEQLRQAAGSLNIGRLAGVLGELLGSITGLVANFVFLLTLLLFLGVEAGGMSDRLASIADDRPKITRHSGTSRGALASTSS